MPWLQHPTAIIKYTQWYSVCSLIVPLLSLSLLRGLVKLPSRISQSVIATQSLQSSAVQSGFNLMYGKE